MIQIGKRFPNGSTTQAMSRNGRRWSTRRRTGFGSRAGITAVEFAIAAPAFFLFTMAAFEFGRLNVIRHTADNAAYEAARYAMVPGATTAEAITKAQSILGIVGTRGARVTVLPANITPDVDQITVTVEVPLDQNGWITPNFTASRSIRASSTLKTERSSE